MQKVIVYLVFIACCLACGSESKLSYQTFAGQVFGTTYQIQLYGEVLDYKNKLDSVYLAINQSVNTYMPESIISRLNKGEAVSTDSIFRNVFNQSKTVYNTTNGFFDPTVGTLRNAYGFGDTQPLVLPAQKLDSLMQYVGFQKVTLTPNGRLKKEKPEIYLDFNAIAKGYAVDCIANLLIAMGVENFLVEIGGEIVTRGKNLNKSHAWVVGIEHSKSELKNRSVSARIQLKDAAMASSGNYRKYRIDTLTGKKYVHTINPNTGAATQTNITSATVVTTTCAMADAYATAIMAMGLEKAKLLLQNHPELQVYLTYLDKNGQEQTYIANGFEALLLK